MKLLLPDELSAEQRAVLDSYRPWLPPGAVCVNVMLGVDPWDIRPLILESNSVFLYRLSRPLSEALCKSYGAEMEGFSVLRACSIRVQRRINQTQFLAIRPYVPKTLQDQLNSGEVYPGPHNAPLASRVISLVREMRGLNLVHGHLAPSNLALDGSSIVLLDPLVGAINGTQDRSVAPEISPDQDVQHPSDLYGLGSVLAALLGDTLSDSQLQIVRRLQLPSPKQRPTLEEVEAAFGSSATNASQSSQPGRVLKRPNQVSWPPKAPVQRTAVPESTGASRRGGLSTTILLVLLLGVVGYVLRYRYPETYFQLARLVPILAPERSAQLESDWESGDKQRMLSVVRAAVLEGNPAAENAIIDSIMGGANPPDTTPRLLRVALSDLWRANLAPSDLRAVLRLTVAPMFPQGLGGMPPLSSLYPGVILAVAGQMPPTDPSSQLKILPLATFTKLPDPVGNVFRQLSELGISSAGAPEAVALAAIISGITNPQVFDAFMGTDTGAKNVIAKLTIVLPILQGNDAASSQLVASIRDRGGDLGPVLSWFDIEDLAKWSTVSGADKLLLVLNQLPQQPLSQAQYADLLTFPLPAIRDMAAGALKTKFFKDADTNLFVTLAGEGNRLTREQTIALISALSLDPAKRVPFISAWFGLKPSPDTVLLLLLARNGYDSSDSFNLEAARYLRRTDWKATPEMLRLLAQHPEPLARTLAYIRLDPKDDAQKKILQDRVSAEKDQGLLKMVMSKLSSDLPAAQPTPATKKP